VPRLADQPTTRVEVDIAAAPDVVWSIVSDISAGAGHSSEFLGAHWVDEPALGATFIGRNRHKAIGEWEVECFVVEYEPERAFSWVTSDRENPGAKWTFTMEPAGGGTLLRYECRLGPGPSGISIAIEAMPDKEERIIERRLEEHAANMTAVVEGMKSTAETQG
jgi:uncharacterized protein YndB with AHSA1/START domain